MLHGKNLLKDNGRWNIGSGAGISVTEDYLWLASEDKALTKQGCVLTTVQDLIDPTTHSWNIGVLRESLDSYPAIEAVKTPIGRSNPFDSLFWPHTTYGNYSVK